MSTAILLAGAIGLLLLTILIPLVGFTRPAVWLLVAAALIAPWPLLILPGSVHFGIAPANPVPTTYGIAIIAVFCSFALSRPKGVPVPWKGYIASFATYMLVWIWIAWDATANVWSGVLHYLLAATALAAGTLVAWAAKDAVHVQRALTASILAVLVIELVLCIAQLAGFPISAYAEVSTYIAENRPIGTFNHPGVLGRFVAVLQIPLIIAAASGDKVVRRLAWCALLIGLPATGLTLSRANTIAVVASLVLWIILSRRSDFRSGGRFAILAVITIAAVPLLNIALARFSIDSAGGDRPELLQLGLRQIASSPIAGTGPNNYVEFVGQFDALTASGYPVHNTFLLSVAELGAAGAILLFWPVFATVIIAFRTWRLPSGESAGGRAILATLPGLMLIANTGWGLLTTSSLVAWMFVVGYAWGVMRPKAAGALERRYVPAPSFAVR